MNQNLLDKLRDCTRSTDILGRKPDGSNIEYEYRSVSEELCLLIERELGREDGGPAFPSPTANPIQNGQLSVRDFFAASVIAVCSAHPFAASWDLKDEWVEKAVRRAYQIADAMVRTR